MSNMPLPIESRDFQHSVVARWNFPNIISSSHLFDGDLLPGGAVPHLDDVAASAVPEVAEQLQVVDRRLHAHAVQLQEAVLKV